MLIEKLEMSAAPSLANHTDFRDHRGVRPTKSGKWGAAIQHPITKASVWLGSYNTPKEAADAYIKKKLEYQSLSFPANSGKRGAKIQDPVNGELVCLGTGNSAAEDANVSTKKKLEFDSIFTNATVEEALNRKRCEAELVGQVEMKCKESNVHVKEAQAVSNTDRAKRLPGSGCICRTKTGRWQAQISYRNSKFHVGTYTSYEEAEAAIHRKRQDLDNVAHVDEAVAKEYRLEERKSDPEFGSKTARKQSVALSESMNGQVTRNQDPEKQVSMRPCGVPVTKVAASVEETLNRKRREFDLIKNAEKKQKQSNVAAAAAEEDIRAHTGTFTKYNVDSVESNANVDDIRVPSSSFVSNQEFSMGVINAHGQLVGEFSRLDDELWLCGSLNDDDDTLY